VYSIMPLDHLLGILNAPPGTTGVSDARRDFVAKAAAPYLHPRLMASDGKDQVPVQYSMDLTKLTDEELMLFERMLIKAHRPVLPTPLDLEAEDDEGGTMQ
jgi:hypothetical protein